MFIAINVLGKHNYLISPIAVDHRIRPMRRPICCLKEPSILAPPHYCLSQWKDWKTQSHLKKENVICLLHKLLVSYYNLQLITDILDILDYDHCMFWGQGRMKNRQNILCLNTVQLSTKWHNIFRGRVGQGPSWLGAELVRGRVC